MTDCYVLPLINSLIRARPKSPVTVISDVIARKMSGMCAAGSQPTTQTDRQTDMQTHTQLHISASVKQAVESQTDSCSRAEI